MQTYNPTYQIKTPHELELITQNMQLLYNYTKISARETIDAIVSFAENTKYFYIYPEP